MMTAHWHTIGLTAGLLVLAAGTPAKTYQYEFHKTVAVEQPLEVTVADLPGDITITIGDQEQVTIDAIKAVEAESEAAAALIADQMQIKVTSTGRQLTVRPELLRVKSKPAGFWEKILGKSGEPSPGAVTIKMAVPPDCHITIDNASGDVSLAGLHGRQTVATRSGDVTIKDIIGEIRVTTSSGKIALDNIDGSVWIRSGGADITVSSLTGDLEIDNGSGAMTGTNISGNLVVSQRSGPVRVEQLDGDIRIRSTSGAITVVQQSGAIDIENESGDITIRTELQSSKDYTVETNTGTIDFAIPESSGGRIHIEARSGKIDAQVPIALDTFERTKISGIFGAGGPRITLATVSGSVRLAEY